MAALQKQERKSTEQDDILALVDEVLSDMKFVGFDMKAFRFMLGKEGWTPKQIVIAITLYCQIGNNTQNVTKKRASELKQYGRDVIAKLKTGVTLPRIAISFAPLTLALRTRGIATGNIQGRFAIDVPDSLQDAALVCYMTKNNTLNGTPVSLRLFVATRGIEPETRKLITTLWQPGTSRMLL